MGKKVWVQGYRRSNGTQVKGHWRTVDSSSSFDLFNASSGLSQQSNQNTQKPKSHKEILIEKYVNQIQEVELLQQKYQNLIEQGEAYIRDPEKVQKQHRQTEIFVYVIAGIIVMAFGLALFNSVLSFFEKGSEKPATSQIEHIQGVEIEGLVDNT